MIYLLSCPYFCSFSPYLISICDKNTLPLTSLAYQIAQSCLCSLWSLALLPPERWPCHRESGAHASGSANLGSEFLCLVVLGPLGALEPVSLQACVPSPHLIPLGASACYIWATTSWGKKQNFKVFLTLQKTLH